MKKFQNRPFMPGEESYYNSKQELQLADKELKQSYYFSKNGIRNFKIKFCVPSKNFKVYQIFSIQREIWIFISDKSNLRAIGRGKVRVLELDFDTNSLPSLDDLDVNTDEVRINILNDNSFSLEWKKSFSISEEEPDEKGNGGVIVNGP